MKLFSLDLPTRLTRLASNPEDDQDTVLKKSALVITSLMVVVAAAIWGIIYVLYDEPLAGAIPLSYAVLSLLSLVWLTRKNFHLYLISQLILMLLLPFLLMTALGGYALSSAVGIWSLIVALGALTFTSRPQAVRVMAIYLALLIIAGLIEPYTRSTNNLPPLLVTLFFVLNLGTVSSIVFLLMAYFVHEKDRFLHLLNLEQQRSESLLLNILPQEIAAILKKEQRVIANQYESVSILFADMVGFTKLSDKLLPQEMDVLLKQAENQRVIAGSLIGCQAVTQGPQSLLCLTFAWPAVDHRMTAEHAFDVAIEDRVSLIEALRQDSSRG